MDINVGDVIKIEVPCPVNKRKVITKDIEVLECDKKKHFIVVNQGNYKDTISWFDIEE